LRLVPDQAPKTGHQKRSQFRFEVPARIASPGGRCRKGRCDCSPASRERFEGTLMNGPQDLAAGLKRALPRKACITQPLLRHILPARTLPAYAEPFKDIKTRRRRQWRGTKAVAGRTLRAALNRPVFPIEKPIKVRGLPQLAKNQRDMGHPSVWGRDKIPRRERWGHTPDYSPGYASMRRECLRLVPHTGS
jgi:hypothetical protein